MGGGVRREGGRARAREGEPLLSPLFSPLRLSLLPSYPIASAPPDPPSPMTTEMMGTRNPNISRRLTAMASPWPSSSAALPAYAPGVSTKVTMGKPKWSACRMKRKALR